MKNLDLALIGNCSVAALIDPRATIVWACFPRFDGDPVFCSLLKAEDDFGFFAIDLADCVHHAQHYRENPAIVVTRLEDAHGGAIEVTDFAPRFGQYGRMFRRFAEQTGSDLKALAACMRSVRRAFSREDLNRIAVPVLIAVGTRDTVAGSAADLAALIPGARVLDIPGRDHMLATGDPVFKRGVLDFLAER